MISFRVSRVPWRGAGREREKWGEEEKETVTGKGAGNGHAPEAWRRKVEQLARRCRHWVWAQEEEKRQTSG